jgi:hypothetical protein
MTYLKCKAINVLGYNNKEGEMVRVEGLWLYRNETLILKYGI